MRSSKGPQHTIASLNVVQFWLRRRSTVAFPLPADSRALNAFPASPAFNHLILATVPGRCCKFHINRSSCTTKFNVVQYEHCTCRLGGNRKHELGDNSTTHSVES